MPECSRLPLLNRGDVVCKGLERRAGAPETQSNHVGHVFRLRGARCRGIDNSCLWQLVLQVQHSLARLAGLSRLYRTQVLGLVTLVEDDLKEREGEGKA